MQRLTAFLAALACVSGGFAAVPTATIKNGTITGLDLPTFKQHAFLGIPYAQPPVGDLRLRRPRPFNESLDTFQATDYSPLCFNVPTAGQSDGSGIEQSEDCLTINVVRPANASSQNPLPVMFWIHGGGLVAGGSGIDWYNGTFLVQTAQNFSNPIIFVSINYRLSQLGFLAGKALADEGNLNLGHYDQRLALHWVQENIEAFGGDPSKVTIFGESSGGHSVGLHFRAFGGRDDSLFHGGISESGTADNYALPTEARFQASYDGLVANTTCRNFTTAETQLSCLRRIPVDEFRFAVKNWSTGAVVDGDIIPLSVANAVDTYRNGRYVKRPTITGANSDEGGGFAGVPTSEEQVIKQLSTSLNLTTSQVQELTRLYPDDPYLGVPYNTGAYMPFGTPFSKQVASIMGDVVFIALRRFVAQELAAQDVPVWTYRFNQIPYMSADAGGVPHFAEVFYVFGNPNCPLHLERCLNPHPYDYALSALMQSMWISFAVHLDPNMNNFPGAPTWPDYSENAENMRFQNAGSSSEKDDFREEGIEFLINEYFPNVGAN
jgi:carboxylesterase type B